MAAAYAPDFHRQLASDPTYAKGIFSIDRGGPKPRKDLAKWADAPDYAAYFFDETFDGAFDLPDNISREDAAAILETYKGVYDPALDKQEWFAAVKALCPSLGFCPEVKEYKKEAPMAIKAMRGMSAPSSGWPPPAVGTPRTCAVFCSCWEKTGCWRGWTGRLPAERLRNRKAEERN